LPHWPTWHEQMPTRLPGMSEYQHYEFLALDRPLTEQQLAELRSIPPARR
jgi:hypothetical protein